MFCVLDCSNNISPAIQVKLSPLIVIVPDVFAMGKAKKKGGTGKPWSADVSSSFCCRPLARVLKQTQDNKSQSPCYTPGLSKRTDSSVYAGIVF